ncbi:hypothetical protein GCM10010869_28980 [Mesorhizobium tianshanense]|uniref:JAB domain-containing protein n=1 Tax=Mesorhizobium tianshanense TaxID=39844 RepID=A0A562NFZ6_9HYPH|nr:hypothetical protein [Mesorhizobium tianshanense]TWI31112.1 hypothetical protein IQ26_04615 [Mesorhizobium tianshanense]GLS37305.1 hypothetical protein GCM10010869_28980 [Mesorhizobium tianshanense]
MASLIATLARSVFGPAPEILCEDAIWRLGIAELHRRTYGRRESGAFLLGSKGKARRIEEFVYYDDIDPHALDTGIIVIDGRCLGDLWVHCRKTGRDVVADVHVHPGGFGQSASDKANPVMAEIGHIAFILPNFAARATTPSGIGVYEYRGARQWRDRSRERPSPLHVGWWPWR